jgi:FtsH-binding integral membrane protein
VKQRAVMSASFGAIVSSLATIGCCLPLGFAAALGTAGASAFFERMRPWLLGVSIVLLGVGFWQRRRARHCAVKRSYVSEVMLWSAVAMVVGMILFPQEIAGFIADRFGGIGK